MRVDAATSNGDYLSVVGATTEWNEVVKLGAAWKESRETRGRRFCFRRGENCKVW